MLVDAHCHLEHPRLEGKTAEIIRRARAAGVERAVSAGSNLANNRKILALAAEHADFIRPMAGLSPHDANSESLEENLAFIKHNKSGLAGIGEIGLDYHHFKKPEERKKQQAVFEAQLALAEELGLSAVIHSRDAEKEVATTLKGFGCRVVMHCFLKPALAKECAARGYFISIPTVDCAERKETVAAVPLGNLLCETDSPFLWRAGANEPANVRTVYEEIARVKNADFNNVADEVYSNARKAFKGL